MRSVIFDKSGTKIAEVPYKAFDFFEGRAMISTLGMNARYGFMDTSGAVVVPVIYESASYFSAGRARVQEEKGKTGFIDQNGQMVVPAVFLDAGSFSEGLAAACTEAGWAYINPAGEMVIPPLAQWKEVPHFSCGRAPFRADDSKWGFIDQTGARVITAQFVGCDFFSEDLCRARVAEDSGFIDLAGNWHIMPIFQRAGYFHQGLASVHQGTQVRFIDTHGETRFDLNAIGLGLEVGSFCEGLCSFKKDGKWGFINLEGRVVIDPIFEYSMPPCFSEGLASVEKEGNLLYVDHTGQVVMDMGPVFTGSDFHSGLASIFYL